MIELRTDTLSSFLELVIDHRGKTPKKLGSDWAEQGYRAISALNIKSDGLVKTDSIRYVDESTYHKWMKIEIERGDILLTSEAPAGEVILWDNDEKIVLSQRVFGLRVNERIYNKYLLYYFQSSVGKNEINRYSSGSTVFGISAKMFDLIQVRCPSLNSQKKIGDFLYAIDQKIACNNKINAELESMAKLIYYYWFVQFDFPDENGKPYKSSGGKMVYNEELKREIPEGWDIDFLSSYIAKDKSGDWGKEAEQGNYTLNVNCIRGADINGIKGQGDLKSPVRYILPKNSHKIIESGDMVVEISGGSPTQSTARATYINAGVLNRFNTPLISSNFCRVITLKQPKWIYSFFQEWQFLYEADFFFGWEGKTSGIKNFLFEQFLENYKTAIPPELLLNKYYETVCDHYNKVQANLLENQKLAELRDWLLPMLMNGQVTIKD